MPLGTNGNIAAFIHLTSGDFEEQVCTLGISKATDVDQTDVDTLKTLWGTYLMPHLSDESVLLRVELRTYDGFLWTSAGAPVDGGDAGSPLPPNCCYLVQKRTALGGRHGRGRMYVPAVPILHTSFSGGVDSAELAAINTDLEDFRFGIVSAGMAPILIRSTGVLGPVITSMVLANKIATQRRRLRP